jgi:hypothetical protein
MIDDGAVAAYRAELADQDAKRVAELESRLDFEARSNELRHRRHIERLLDCWSHATVTADVAEALGLTPLQYVARYGGDRLNRFVAAWSGNSTQAAVEAGYGTKRQSAASTSTLLMQVPLVFAAIREKIRNGITGKILSLQELQVLWSQDALFGEDPKTRHQAREALAKTFGAFVQKNETTLQGGEKPLSMEHKMPDSVARLLDEHLG